LRQIREDIRRELERAEQSAEVNQRLAPVQKLQHELIERFRQADPARTTPSPVSRDTGQIATFRTILNRLNQDKSA
jgi:hypothetical protein